MPDDIKKSTQEDQNTTSDSSSLENDPEFVALNAAFEQSVAGGSHDEATLQAENNQNILDADGILTKGDKAPEFESITFTAESKNAPKEPDAPVNNMPEPDFELVPPAEPAKELDKAVGLQNEFDSSTEPVTPTPATNIGSSDDVANADDDFSPKNDEFAQDDTELAQNDNANFSEQDADGQDTEKGKQPGLFGRFKRKPAEKEQKVKYKRLESVCTAAPTVSSRLYGTMALAGFLIVTAFFLLQTVPALQQIRGLWYSDELRQADVLRNVFNGEWLRLCLNGSLYQEAPPFYFWFLAGLYKLLAMFGFDIGTDYAQLLFYGTAVSGLLFVWAVFLLARTVGNLDRRGSFAAGCVILSSLFIVFFFHYSNIDLFFAAFIIFSHIFMFKGLMHRRAPFYMGMAFLCMAVAIMTKGALGFVFPLLSAVVFCIWSGRPGRLLKPDFLLGLIFALLPVVLWLGNIWAAGEHETVLNMLKEQVWNKAFGPAPRHEPWWYYLAMLPLVWLPWSFVFVLAPWHKIFSSNITDLIKSARSGERQGVAFIWVMFISGFILLSLIQNKQPAYLMPLFGPLAVLCGRAVLNFSPVRSMLLQRLTAVMFFVLAAGFVLLPVYYSGSIPAVFAWLESVHMPEWEVKLNGIFLLAVILLGAICLLIGTVKARRPESTLLILLLTTTLFSYPMATMTMPSLDSVLSSKAASVEIKRYTALGYYPISFGVYHGVFSYYSGDVIHETDDWSELDRIMDFNPKVIVVMSARRWSDWVVNPGLTEIMRFWMLSNEYVLLLCNNSLESLDLDNPETGLDAASDLDNSTTSNLNNNTEDTENMPVNSGSSNSAPSSMQEHSAPVNGLALPEAGGAVTSPQNDPVQNNPEQTTGATATQNNAPAQAESSANPALQENTAGQPTVPSTAGKEAPEQPQSQNNDAEKPENETQNLGDVEV
ncbi:hypothetical protein LJB93_00695 [Desulfovibrio sp. OttesenSCG-928-F07]|nr:hypothetical protein [Desulfovibrio sp. OttesenSCG-928-F07]